jgi:hypothetical protein
MTMVSDVVDFGFLVHSCCVGIRTLECVRYDTLHRISFEFLSLEFYLHRFEKLGTKTGRNNEDTRHVKFYHRRRPLAHAITFERVRRPVRAKNETEFTGLQIWWSFRNYA